MLAVLAALPVLAVSLSQAKTIAVVVAVALVAAAIAWAWLMKTIVQKVIGLVVLLGLAGVVWYQRDSLQDCADRVRANATVAGADTTCSILGQDVDIPNARG